MLADGGLAHMEHVGEVARARAGVLGELERDAQTDGVAQGFQAARVGGNVGDISLDRMEPLSQDVYIGV